MGEIPDEVLDEVEDQPCNVCGRWSVIMNRFGRLICQRCLSDQGDTALKFYLPVAREKK